MLSDKPSIILREVQIRHDDCCHVLAGLSVRILILTHYFPPHHGGIENVAINEATILAGSSHDVTVLTSRIPTRQEIHLQHHELFDVIRVGASNVLEKHFGIPFPLFGPKLYPLLTKAIKNADIVHAHGHVYMASVVGSLIAKHYDKPFVLTQHNTFIDYDSYHLRLLQHLADMFLGKPTLARASRIIAVSEATKEYLLSILPVDVTVQYNGVDVHRFHPSDDQAALRNALNLPTHKTICLTIRRITSKNGIEDLLNVAEILLDNDDVFFVIGGTGSEFGLAQRTVREKRLENVLLLGAINEDYLPSYYAAADIFVLPSRRGEGFPLVVLEALASGLPVIATRSGGHVEIMKSRDIGSVVEPGQPQLIAECIRNLTSNAGRLEKSKAACREFAESSLSWEAHVDALIAMYEEIMR